MPDLTALPFQIDALILWTLLSSAVWCVIGGAALADHEAQAKAGPWRPAMGCVIVAVALLTLPGMLVFWVSYAGWRPKGE